MGSGFFSFFDSIFGFLGEVFSGRTGEVVEIVLEVGKPIVEALVDEDLPGDVKRDNAINQVASVLEERGTQVAKHAIGLGVELLVAQLKR